MAFPIVPLTRPAVLAGQANGQLDPSILMSTPGLAGGPDVVLVEPAARAWRALTAAASAAGHTFKATSLADSYRSRAIQQRIFDQRYTTTHTGIGCKTCDGVRYCKRTSGFATAACPGTSNHGWGLAVDTGVELDGDTGTESISWDKDALNWLVDNEQRFGFSHELQDEPWHIRYVAGDNIPAAVIEHEGGIVPSLPASGGSRLLRKGMSGEDVRGWQTLVGVPADGVFGPKTETATKSFQRRVSIPADGVVGPQTRAAMEAVIEALFAVPAPRLLRKGVRGDDVAHWQTLVQVPADGVFGARTETATRAFQRKVGLIADGVVGPQTRAAMDTVVRALFG